MKKLFAILLAAAMLLSLAACGDQEHEPQVTDPTIDQTVPAGNNKTTDNEIDLDTIVLRYGTNHYEEYTATIFCPEGAFFAESSVDDYRQDGYTHMLAIYDDVLNYTAYSADYWSRPAYSDEPEAYDVLPQLYFDGELDEDTAAQYEDYSQTVTDLGFQWEGKDVILIETRRTVPGESENVDVYVGVEYEIRYKEEGEGGAVQENLTTPGLIGFHMYSLDWDGNLTADQCAWIAGQIFGVDSGRTWTQEGEETSAPGVDASELCGTWIELDSASNKTYTFNEDGTGLLGGDSEDPFTYEVSDDNLTLTYEDGEQESFTISDVSSLLTLVNEGGHEVLWERQEEETAEPTDVPEETEEEKKHYPYETEIVGKWVNNESGFEETYIFNADGTGKYFYTDGDYFEWTLTYTFKTSKYVELQYSDDTTDEIYIDINGGKMLLTNDYVTEMEFVRQ